MNSYSDVYDFEKLSPLREPRKKPQTGEKVLLLGDFRFSLRGAKYYSVIAYFDSVDGLREGANYKTPPF